MLANTLTEELMQVVTWIFLVVATLIVPLAIWLGFKLAKAGDPNKRREAKKHMINAVASLIIILILIGAMQIPALWANIGDGGGGGGGGGSGGSGAGWVLAPSVMQTGASSRLVLTHNGVIVTDAEFRIVSGGGTVSGDILTAGSNLSVIHVGISVPGQNVPNRTIVVTNEQILHGDDDPLNMPGAGGGEGPPPGPGGHQHADGQWSWPLANRTGHNYNHFGLPRSNRTRAHVGIDLPSGMFTNTNYNFYSVADGFVDGINWSGTSGNYDTAGWIRVRHPGPWTVPGHDTPFQNLWSFYLVYSPHAYIIQRFHAASTSNEIAVSQGERLGRIGRLLHFEIYTVRSAVWPVAFSNTTTRGMEDIAQRLHPLRMLGGNVPNNVPATFQVDPDNGGPTNTMPTSIKLAPSQKRDEYLPHVVVCNVIYNNGRRVYEFL